jgi:hypothetical protein
MRAFIKGESTIESSPFWMLNFLRFKPGGLEPYKKYVDGIAPLMAKVGGRPILLCSKIRKVIDGNGVF